MMSNQEAVGFVVSMFSWQPVSHWGSFALNRELASRKPGIVVILVIFSLRRDEPSRRGSTIDRIVAMALYPKTAGRCRALGGGCYLPSRWVATISAAARRPLSTAPFM
jgi:hypothetical protein